MKIKKKTIFILMCLQIAILLINAIFVMLSPGQPSGAASGLAKVFVLETVVSPSSGSGTNSNVQPEECQGDSCIKLAVPVVPVELEELPATGGEESSLGEKLEVAPEKEELKEKPTEPELIVEKIRPLYPPILNEKIVDMERTNMYYEMAETPLGLWLKAWILELIEKVKELF